MAFVRIPVKKILSKQLYMHCCQWDQQQKRLCEYFNSFGAFRGDDLYGIQYCSIFILIPDGFSSLATVINFVTFFLVAVFLCHWNRFHFGVSLSCCNCWISQIGDTKWNCFIIFSKRIVVPRQSFRVFWLSSFFVRLRLLVMSKRGNSGVFVCVCIVSALAHLENVNIFFRTISLKSSIIYFGRTSHNKCKTKSDYGITLTIHQVLRRWRMVLYHTRERLGMYGSEWWSRFHVKCLKWNILGNLFMLNLWLHTKGSLLSCIYVESLRKVRTKTPRSVAVWEMGFGLIKMKWLYAFSMERYRFELCSVHSYTQWNP